MFCSPHDRDSCNSASTCLIVRYSKNLADDIYLYSARYCGLKTVYVSIVYELIAGNPMLKNCFWWAKIGLVKGKAVRDLKIFLHVFYKESFLALNVYRVWIISLFSCKLFIYTSFQRKHWSLGLCSAQLNSCKFHTFHRHPLQSQPHSVWLERDVHLAQIFVAHLQLHPLTASKSFTCLQILSLTLPKSQYLYPLIVISVYVFDLLE